MIKSRSESRSGCASTARSGSLAFVVLTLALAWPLAGCDERVLETGVTYGHVRGELFGFEPLPEPAPAPVRRMSGLNPDFPGINTVPMRPAAPLTEKQRQQVLDRLASDRESGHLAEELLKEVAPPPLPVPPAPVPPAPGSTKGSRAPASTPPRP
ncbi:MAG: hypothetical protein WCF85_02100 [Rhodospirillaceae bacterium]